jgi:hypothetical protein
MSHGDKPRSEEHQADEHGHEEYGDGHDTALQAAGRGMVAGTVATLPMTAAIAATVPDGTVAAVADFHGGGTGSDRGGPGNAGAEF